MPKKKLPQTIEECNAELERTQKQLQQYENRNKMEADGIITRTVYPEVPPRVEYALSELGESMRPIIKAMEVWGTDYKNNNGQQNE